MNIVGCFAILFNNSYDAEAYFRYLEKFPGTRYKDSIARLTYPLVLDLHRAKTYEKYLSFFPKK